MFTSNDVINRTSKVLSRMPFLQSPDGFRSFLISAGLTDFLGQIDFFGKAPDAFWTNLVWDLLHSGNTDSIELLLNKAKERVGIDIREDLDNLLKDWKIFLGQQKGSIYQGDLWRFLPNGTDKTLARIRANSRNFLIRDMPEFCSDYVQHSLDHPDRAIAILNNWLLDDEQKQYLQDNEWMVFFLYASIYLHDIGLSFPPSLNSDLPTNSRAELLESHAERGALIINQYWNELGIEDSIQANILAKVCLAHQNFNIEDKQIKRRMPYRQTGKHINIQFIIGCLRLISELDLDTHRITFLLERFLPSITDVDNEFAFGGVGPHDSYLDTINAYIRCHSSEIHRAFKNHEGFVQACLNEINRNISPRFKYGQVIYDIEAVDYEPIDFRFRVEASAALEVFMGTPVYTDKATFLRELLQNSIDACDLKRLYHQSYSPKITVERKSDFRTVIVRDNGIGMDRTWIEKYLLSVGISFYRSEEFENVHNLDVGFAPISRFGIGILSCFMVAEKVVIRTKKSNSNGVEMVIQDFRNYFDVRLDNSIELGTEIILVLKQEFFNIDCLGYLLDNIKCTKYPVEYIYFDGEKRVIAQESVSLVEKLKVDFWSNEWESYLEESIVLLSPNSEGYLAFSKSGAMSVCEVHVFQDGIYVCNEPALLPQWMKRNMIGRINLRDEDRVDISISRIGILKNSKYDNLKTKLKKGLIALISKILTQLRSLNQERSSYRNSANKFMESHVNLSAIDESLRELLKKHYCFELFDRNQNVQGYYFFEELTDTQQIITLRNVNKLSKYRGDKLRFVVGEDARIFQLLNPEKRFRDSTLLNQREKIHIQRLFDSNEIVIGEDDFFQPDPYPDQNIDD